MMNLEEHQKKDRLEDTLSTIRKRFGDEALIRGTSVTKDLEVLDDESDLSF